MGVMQTIPMTIGGMYSAGDASTIPEGFVRSLRNYLARPNRWDGRPPFVYDTLMAVMGLARWEDNANQRASTMAFDATKIYKKPTTGLAWDSGTSATFGTRLTDFTNIYGLMYAMFDDGAGNPTAALSYNGTSASAAPFDSTLYSRTVTAFGERLFLCYPRVVVTPQYLTSLNGAVYDMTSANWHLTNAYATTVTFPGATVCRVYPTSTTASTVHYSLIGSPWATGPITVAAASAIRKAIWRADFRGVHATYRMPITMQWSLSTGWEGNTAYTAGCLISDGTNLQRCSVGGTSLAVGSPAWATTVGATTTDNTVTWVNEGSHVIASLEAFIPNATEQPDFTTYSLPMVVPYAINELTLIPMLKFINSSVSAITLAPIEVSLKDGLADGDPRKANRGQQFTLGDFNYPFFNCESATTATINLDSIIWSEIGKPRSILAKNTFPLTEVPGLPTAATLLSQRLIVFKRRGMWVFALTDNKNEPILPERATNEEVGCIGPRALDKFMNELFWIGENECYRMKIDGDPQPFCGPGMREEIMSKGSGWVESAATYKMPLLAIDRSNKEVWIYTQAGKIYVFNLETETWSYIDVSGSPPVRSMIFDTIGERMLVSFGGYGVTRFMETSAAKDTIDTGAALTITNDIVFKPLELYAPRYEAQLEEIGIFHLATASQTGQTITPSYSLDRGSTFTVPSTYTGGVATVDITQPRIPLPIGTLGPSVTVKLSRAGFGGATNWSISKADATLELLRGELPYANAT